MTSISDFPPDVQAIAQSAHRDFADSRCDDNLTVIIARAIMADRAGRLNVAGLTARQAACFRFIADYQRAHGGVSPTYDEIKGHLGIASKGSVARLIDKLEERGRIARLPDRARSITIVEAN